MTVPPMVSSLECQNAAKQLSRGITGKGADASAANTDDKNAWMASSAKSNSTSKKTLHKKVKSTHKKAPND